MSWDELEKLAKWAAESGMFGITKPAQALCLFAICKSEGLDPVAALKRYDIIQGKPAMKARAMAAEFMAAGGGIVWHIRTDAMAAATFFENKKEITDGALALANDRFNLLWELDGETEEEVIIKLNTELARKTRPGQETIFRSYADAEAKNITKTWDLEKSEWKDKHNWKQSPRQMLTARVESEGIGLVKPNITTGIYTPDELQDSIIPVVTTGVVHVVHDSAAEILLKKDHLTFKERESIQTMIANYLEDAKVASPQRAAELKGLAAELRCKLSDDDLKHDEIPMTHEKPQPIPVATDTPRVPWREYVLCKVRSKSLIGKALGQFDAKQIRVIAEKSLPQGLESRDPEVRVESTYIMEADKELNPNQYSGGLILKKESGPFDN